VVDVSIIAPVFDEQGNLVPLHQRLVEAMEPLGCAFEVLYVDDGSRDAGFVELASIALRDRRARIIQLRRNFGQTAAIAAGIDHARGEVLVFIDADLQNDPADIPRMIAALRANEADMVIGVRVNRHDTWSRKVQSRIGNGVRNWITNDKITDTGCSLKLVKREAIDAVKLYTGMHRFLPTLVRMAGYKVIEMPVNHRARKFGVSKYGAMNRAFRGLVDCMAVRWMGKRMLRYKVSEEQS
jgi:glycosyltransferase involved in cell wall biosynthesis